MSRKVVICATDAGGLSNLLPVSIALSKKGWNVSLIARKRHSIYLEDVDITGLNLRLLDESADGNCIWDDWSENVPDVFLGGRTCVHSLERELSNIWRDKIPTFGLVDEYYNYHNLFADRDGSLAFLPKWVFLPDDLARTEAIKDGLPAISCVAAGLPSLLELEKKKFHYTNTLPERPPAIVGTHRRIVTFLSETFILDYGSKPGESGRMGSFAGYTEETVLDSLLGIFSKAEHPTLLINKIHPAGEMRDFQQPVQGNVQLKVVKNCNLSPLMFHSDLVVGMRSIALLEAALLGCPTISFQPGLIGEQRCTAVRLGLVSSALDEREFFQCYHQILNGDDHRYRDRGDQLMHFHRGSIHRILDFIESKT
jgi:hypothetical protein